MKSKLFKPESIYNKAPYFLKVMLLNIKVLLNYRKRYSEQYQFYLDEYMKLWYEPLEVVAQKCQIAMALPEGYPGQGAASR